jgi:hypothetical protein
MIHIRRIEEPEWPLWDEFVRMAKGGTLQHQSLWLMLSAKVSQCIPVVWGVFKGEALIGGCALLEDLSEAAAKCGPCCQYNGLVFSDTRSEKAYRHERMVHKGEEALAEELPKHYQTVVMHNHPSIIDVRPFIWAGWNVEVCYDYFWVMKDPETLKRSMHHDIRRQLKIAEGNGLHVRTCHDWNKVLQLWRLSFNHKGLRLLLDPKKIGHWYEVLAKMGMALTYLAETGRSAVAGLTIVKDKKTLYLWFNGLNPDYRRSGANTLLMWQAMMDHLDTHERFDLCGGDVPGVAAYKSSLGASFVPYYRVNFLSNPRITRKDDCTNRTEQ